MNNGIIINGEKFEVKRQHFAKVVGACELCALSSECRAWRGDPCSPFDTEDKVAYFVKLKGKEK